MFEQQNATNIYTIRQEKFLKANNVRFLHLLLNIFYYFIINDDCFLFILIYALGTFCFWPSMFRYNVQSVIDQNNYFTPDTKFNWRLSVYENFIYIFRWMNLALMQDEMNKTMNGLFLWTMLLTWMTFRILLFSTKVKVSILLPYFRTRT